MWRSDVTVQAKFIYGAIIGKRFNVSLPTLLLLKPCKRVCSQQTGKEGIEPSNSG